MTFVFALIVILAVSLAVVAVVPRVLARRPQLDALNAVARVPVPVGVLTGSARRGSSHRAI